MAGCSREVSDDIPIGFSGGRIYFPEPNLHSSGLRVTYTELEDATPVPSVMGNSSFSPGTKLELGKPKESA